MGLIESCEESGSHDLPAYIEALQPRLGNVGLVVCLDSGAGNYDQLWLTTGLRGMVSGVLKVEVLTDGIHSVDSFPEMKNAGNVLRPYTWTTSATCAVGAQGMALGRVQRTFEQGESSGALRGGRQPRCQPSLRPVGAESDFAGPTIEFARRLSSPQVPRTPGARVSS